MVSILNLTCMLLNYSQSTQIIKFTSLGVDLKKKLGNTQITKEILINRENEANFFPLYTRPKFLINRLEFAFIICISNRYYSICILNSNDLNQHEFFYAFSWENIEMIKFIKFAVVIVVYIRFRIQLTKFHLLFYLFIATNGHR